MDEFTWRVKGKVEELCEVERRVEETGSYPYNHQFMVTSLLSAHITSSMCCPQQNSALSPVPTMVLLAHRLRVAMARFYCMC